MYTFATADAIPDLAHLQATIVLECIHFAPRRVLARAHTYFAHLDHAPSKTSLMRTNSTSSSANPAPESTHHTPFPATKEANHEPPLPKKRRFLRVVLDSEDEAEAPGEQAASVKPPPPTYPPRYIVLDDREWEIYEVRSETHALGIARNPAIHLGKGVRLYAKEFFNHLLNSAMDRDRARDQARELARFGDEDPVETGWRRVKEMGNKRSRKKAGIPEGVPDGSPLYYWLFMVVEGLLERE